MRRTLPLLLLLMGVALAAPGNLKAAAPVPSPTPPEAAPPSFSEEGLASRYGGTGAAKTADGEHFNPQALTGAHRSLPFHTVVRVTDLDSGKTAKIRINDRGPYRKTRIVDLSTAAAALLGMVKNRIDKVRLEVFAADQKEGEAVRPGAQHASWRQPAKRMAGKVHRGKRRQMAGLRPLRSAKEPIPGL